MIVKYTGDFTTSTEHPSGQSTLTTQAHAAAGEAEHSYNPVQMMCVAGAACLQSMIGVAAQTHGFSVAGMETRVSYTMQDGPRRLASVSMEIHIPAGTLTSKEKRFIEAASRACPVMSSLSEEVEKKVTFIYE